MNDKLYRYIGLAFIGAAVSTISVRAQAPDATAGSTTTATPVAWVYVSYAPDLKSSNAHKVAGWKAWADGALTPMTGSPFNENVGGMAVNGSYLMAVSNSTPDINTYALESGGVLKYVTAINYGKYNNSSSECGAANQLFFDHTGSSLYVQEFDASSACSNDGIASFSLNKTTGRLTYLGLANVGAFPGTNSAAYFLGNNVYAYNALNSGCMYYQINGFKRASSGLLSDVPNVEKNSPTPSSSFGGYVPNMAVADPTNHVAVHMSPASPPGCVNLPPQLATFTADSSGYLTTTNTYSNMPVTLINSPYDMKMSPSGKLLAVGGQQGLQIFHFNGASPITHYTNLIVKTPIRQMFWDNDNHLYAIGSAGLSVFTVTPAGWSQATGSPHAIANPAAVIVQPR